MAAPKKPAKPARVMRVVAKVTYKGRNHARTKDRFELALEGCDHVVIRYAKMSRSELPKKVACWECSKA
jgi:hypothetical protein